MNKSCCKCKLVQGGGDFGLVLCRLHARQDSLNRERLVRIGENVRHSPLSSRVLDPGGASKCLNPPQTNHILDDHPRPFDGAVRS
jgi:hypothetical protein